MSISELLVSSFSGIFGMVSSWFGGINLASLFLPYLMIFDNLLKILLGHFSSIHFWFLLTLVNYFSILLFCIFGTFAGYILIVGGSLLEMELLSLIVIECVLSSFQQHKLPI